MAEAGKYRSFSKLNSENDHKYDKHDHHHFHNPYGHEHLSDKAIGGMCYCVCARLAEMFGGKQRSL